MDIYGYITETCNQMAQMDKDITRAMAWYLFEDRREGSIQTRFDADASEYSSYRRMFQP